MSDCARSACRRPNATFYNLSTKKLYCAACAEAINRTNRCELVLPAKPATLEEERDLLTACLEADRKRGGNFGTDYADHLADAQRRAAL